VDDAVVLGHVGGAEKADFVVDEATVPEALPKVPHPARIAVQDAALQEVPDREVDEGAQIAQRIYCQ